ncbi:MAG: hypothetical protein LUM44_19260 [Pyrinomonadaceae bacterium]|nr:hypothetical protein [Pyrinomonadaceae bacterium]
MEKAFPCTEKAFPPKKKAFPLLFLNIRVSKEIRADCDFLSPGKSAEQVLLVQEMFYMPVLFTDTGLAN